MCCRCLLGVKFLSMGSTGAVRCFFLSSKKDLAERRGCVDSPCNALRRRRVSGKFFTLADKAIFALRIRQSLSVDEVDSKGKACRSASYP